MDRERLAMFVRRAVQQLRDGALNVELAADRGTVTGMQRPAFYRERADEAIAGLVGITRGIAAVVELLTRYAALYPAAHDDDVENAGRCLCGRPAESCPARAAAEAGEPTWVDEDGNSHPLADAAPPLQNGPADDQTQEPLAPA